MKKLISILIICILMITGIMVIFTDSNKGTLMNPNGYLIQITSLETNQNKTIIRLNMSDTMPKVFLAKIYIEDKNNKKAIFYINQTNLKHESCGKQKYFFVLNNKQVSDFIKLKCNPTFRYAIRVYDMCIDVN